MFRSDGSLLPPDMTEAGAVASDVGDSAKSALEDRAALKVSRGVGRMSLMESASEGSDEASLS